MMTKPQSSAIAKTRHRNMPVDTLRGLACVLLVTMHVIGYNERQGIHVPIDSAFRWYTESFEYLRMPLFTFLSGFVYGWRPAARGQYGRFMGKKARRLLVPYVVFVALIGVMQTIVPGANNPTDLVPWEWFLYSLAPYWFLISTFWIFAVVALLDSFNLLRRWYVLGAFAALMALINVFVMPPEQTVLQFGNALSLSPFFLIGIMATRFKWTQLNSRWALLVAGVVVVCGTYTQLGMGGIVPAVESRSNIVGIIFGAAFPILFLMLKIEFKPLAWIGRYSSGIFLLHPFAVAGTREIVQALGVLGLAVQFIIISIAGIGFSILGTWVLQQVKLGRVIIGERA